MPNQRDPSKKLVGGYVDPVIKEKIAELGVEEATAVEMLLIESLIKHRRMTTAEVAAMAGNGKLRAATVIWLRSIGVLKSPVPVKE